MKLGEFGAGKNNVNYWVLLDELRKEVLKTNPKTEAQTWEEFKLKRKYKSSGKCKQQ